MMRPGAASWMGTVVPCSPRAPYPGTAGPWPGARNPLMGTDVILDPPVGKDGACESSTPLTFWMGMGTQVVAGSRPAVLRWLWDLQLGSWEWGPQIWGILG